MVQRLLKASVWAVSSVANLVIAMLYRASVSGRLADVARNPRETVIFVALLLAAVLCFSLLLGRQSKAINHVLAGLAGVFLVWGLFGSPSIGLYVLGGSLLALASAAIAVRHRVSESLLFGSSILVGVLAGLVILLLAA